MGEGLEVGGDQLLEVAVDVALESMNAFNVRGSCCCVCLGGGGRASKCTICAKGAEEVFSVFYERYMGLVKLHRK